jgi:hypothetical protein
VNFKELKQRLELLALGETEVLSRRQFTHAFAGDSSLDQQKRAAAELGESAGCRVLFTGEDIIYAVFTRRQRRDELMLHEI